MWTAVGVVKCGSGLFILVICFLSVEHVYGQLDACGPGRFGPPACQGICHCLSGPDVCDVNDGACSDSYCDYGWTQAPTCQKACNNTFGPQCVYTCHCPVNDTCDPVNGLCSSGSCITEWYGAGCQIRLPKLISVPELLNVTCGEVVLQWKPWKKDFDNGQGPIHSYSIFQNVGQTSTWQLVQTVPVTATDGELYSLPIDVTETESVNRFRVDSNMLDDGKRVNGLAGLPSDGVIPSCTTTTRRPTTPAKTTPSTTTSSSTTPPPTTTPPSTIPPSTTELLTAPPTSMPTKSTTARPPGPHILDEVTVGETGADYILFNWTFLANVTNQTIDMFITYKVSAIGDCNASFSGDAVTLPVNQSTNSFLLDELEPWRRYDVTLSATNEFNITDHVTLSVTTGEILPSGLITPSDIQLDTAGSTGLTVSWNNIECSSRGGDLMFFEVLITPEEDGLTPWVLKSDSTTLTIGELNPYTEYSVSVRYVNRLGAPDFGGHATFRTAEDVPSPPIINTTEATSNSINITWFKPSPANGVIRQYGISYRAENGLESFAPLDFLDRKASLTDLKPYTTYTIKVRARTLIGWGNYSESVTVRSLQAAPGPPSQLRETARNETCINLEWTVPEQKNGVLMAYQVSYRQISTHHSRGLDKTTVDVTLTGTITTTTVCQLQEATYYQFEIKASTAAGYGPPSVALHAWTLQGIPEPPPKPIVLALNGSTITLELNPAVVTKGPISFYRIVVDILGEDRRRRQTQENPLELPGYVAAELPANNIAPKTLFVVGDGRSYGGFQNPKLQSGKTYDIAFVVISELEGLNRSSFSRVDNPVQTVEPTEPQPVVTDNTARDVGIAIAVILLILIILLILFLLWYRRNRASKYFAFSAYNKDSEKVHLSVYNEDDDLLKYWSKTHAFTQRRHVVAGIQYVQSNRGINPQDILKTQTTSSKTSSKPFISLHKEFYSLPRKSRSCTTANKRKNQQRNRFDHLLPYDHSRVVLKPDEHSDNDYINASYIAGYKKRDAYIAAMSPFNEETVLDFWRMIYQLRLPTVVMITKVEEEQFIKCTQYWPDVQAVVTFANFILQLEEVHQYPDYVVRIISLKGREDSTIHTVTVFDYLSWPEHGVPKNAIPLLDLRQKVRSMTPSESPVLVHCGTGVGRTGCFIAIDALLEQYQREREVNVFQYVKQMRENRVSMVRTIRQYAFIYDALFEAVVIGHVQVGEDLKERYRDMIRRNPKTGHTYLKDQFLSLQEFTPKLKKEECSTALLPCNMAKNRYPDLVPPNAHRVIINTLGGPERTDYINAVFLDSHTRKNNYILTQNPLSSTVLDFWKLVYDHKVTSIVMMEEQKADQGHAQYWPDDDHLNIETNPYVVENTENSVEGDDGQIIIFTLRVHNLQNPRAQPREVKLFQLHSWTGPSFVPSSKTVLLDLIDLVDDWQRFSSGDTTPILAHCSDGATQSGLFCAVSIICSKMLHDGTVDVYHTIKHLKRRRPQIVDQLEQYRFCYKALWDFISLRLIEKSFSQGSETQGDKLYAAPSLNLSVYSSIYDVDDDVALRDQRHQLSDAYPPSFSALYRDGFI